MKRREFLSVAGMGAGAVLAAGVRSSQAEEKRPPEKRLQVYKCEVCGAIVEMLEPGEPSLVHCGEPMKLLKELLDAPGAVKHVPVIEKVDGGYLVKVGPSAHPMMAAHYIPWIELIADGNVYRQFLKPGDKPQAQFAVTAKEVSARAYCNLHGLWKDA